MLCLTETRLLQIHWFSIFNSFMMVIFLTGLVSMILLRTLRADYARYTRDDDDLEALERDMNEESGWKLVHGDVFRSPKYLEFLAALIGTGCQLALLILLTILVTIAGEAYIKYSSLVWKSWTTDPQETMTNFRELRSELKFAVSSS